MPLNRESLERYARHIFLPEIGGPGQARLRKACIALVGLGGLGNPAALYLAAAGIGRLRLIDPDQISLSNLQRQILFKTANIGESKVKLGAEALSALNPDCRITALEQSLNDANAARLIKQADIILDGSDNYTTRFAVNHFCVQAQRPLISGAVERWNGQLCVLAGPGSRHKSPCYRCLVPEMPYRPVPCAENGIVGAVAGIVGTRMALEAIRLLAQTGPPPYGRLWLYDALNSQERNIRLPRDPECPECGDQSATTDR